MNKEFAPYKESLELKQLGFDEECFGFYIHKGELRRYTNFDGELNDFQTLKNSSITMGDNWCAAPTFSQAFRWFESKGYRNYVASNHFGGKVNYWFAITPPKELTYSDIKGRNSKEEAELACLVALIEIVKKKQ